MAYATEAELEDRSNRTFDANSKPTTTQVGKMLTEMSNMLDGLCHEASGGLGTLEWTTQAVISGCMYSIDMAKKGEEIDQVKLISILKAFIPDADEGKKIFSYQDYPDAGGNW